MPLPHRDVPAEIWEVQDSRGNLSDSVGGQGQVPVQAEQVGGKVAWCLRRETRRDEMTQEGGKVPMK